MSSKGIGQVAEYKPLNQYGMDELAARQRSIVPSGGVMFARNADREQKEVARQYVLELFHPDCWPGRLHMLTLPGVNWRFERLLLGTREVGWLRDGVEAPQRTFFTSAENDRSIYFAAIAQMPGLHKKAPLKQLRPFPFAERGVKTRFASFFFANIDDFMAHGEWESSWDAAWLDYIGPLSVERLELIKQFYEKAIRHTLIITALKARWNRETSAAINQAGTHSDWLREHLSGDVLHDLEYIDTVPMVQFAIRHNKPVEGTDMAYADTGMAGAKRPTWRTVNPRALLKTTIVANKTASNAELRELFWKEVEDDKNYLRSIVESFLDNNMRSMMLPTPAPRSPAKKPNGAALKSNGAAVAKIKQKLQERVNYEAKIALLELVMPNNKVLGDCTGPECKKFGGWFANLAKRVPRNKTVAQTLSEEQVRKLYKGK
jgi:hypothetical protein